MRKAELLRKTKELKGENNSLREQLEALRQELKQLRQDVKIGIGLRSPRPIAIPTRDTATSLLDSLQYPALSLPAGSRAYVGTKMSSTRGPSVLSDRRSLARIEESGCFNRWDPACVDSKEKLQRTPNLGGG